MRPSSDSDIPHHTRKHKMDEREKCGRAVKVSPTRAVQYSVECGGDDAVERDRKVEAR